MDGYLPALGLRMGCEGGGGWLVWDGGGGFWWAMCNQGTNEPLSSPKYLVVIVESCELCIMATDTEVILQALQNDRNTLHERILQLDRIIGRIRSIDYKEEKEEAEADLLPVTQPAAIDNAPIFPKTADIKIQVLRVFEIINRAAPLAELQQEFTNVTGSNYKIRETVRSLYNIGLLKQIKYKNASRGFLWVKADWIAGNSLIDKHKPVGFDLLYKVENLMFI